MVSVEFQSTDFKLSSIFAAISVFRLTNGGIIYGLCLAFRRLELRRLYCKNTPLFFFDGVFFVFNLNQFRHDVAFRANVHLRYLFLLHLSVFDALYKTKSPKSVIFLPSVRGPKMRRLLDAQYELSDRHQSPTRITVTAITRVL